MRDTHIDIVVHDGNVIENVGKLSHIGHRLTIGTSKWRIRNGRGDVEILCRRLRTQFLEESKEILRIGGRNLVTADARQARVFPTKR